MLTESSDSATTSRHVSVAFVKLSLKDNESDRLLTNFQSLTPLESESEVYTASKDSVNVFRQVMAVSGWSLITLLILASLFIIVNTIRLTVIARGEEISIMQLVGATDRFIKGPFLIEGFIIGIIGAAISVSFLYFIYAIVIHQLIDKMPFFPFITDDASLYYIYGFVLLSGATIGMLGAYISVSRSLRVR